MTKIEYIEWSEYLDREAEIKALLEDFEFY